MAKHDKRIDKKIGGDTWNNIRSNLTEVHNVLLSVNESVASELTTIYIKYKVVDEPMGGTFAVMWVKTAKRVVLGLATPEKVNHKDVIDAPQGMKYKGLTSYLKITIDQAVPGELKQWAMMAFGHIEKQRELSKLSSQR